MVTQSDETCHIILTHADCLKNARDHILLQNTSTSNDSIDVSDVIYVARTPKKRYLYNLYRRICCFKFVPTRRGGGGGEEKENWSPIKFHVTCSRRCRVRMMLINDFVLILCLLGAFVCGVFMLDRPARSQPPSAKNSSASVVMNLRYRKSRKKPSLGDPFNPDAWNNRSANTNKHYVVLYWSKIRGHMARIQKKKDYEKDEHIWPYTYVGENCPISCELTNDRSRASEADAFVVHSRLTDVFDFPPFEYLAPWILQNNENPVYTPALSDPRIMNKFNLLISYRLDSDFPSPIYPMPSRSEPIPFAKRLGNVLAVFSKCELVRTEYMRQLMRYIDVHSYGACIKNREGLIGLYGQVNGKYVFKDYKLVLTRFYKFSLVFMNQDCDFFVDDRLYHALETGSVPVYMGTDKIDQFLPGNLKNAIIKVSDYESPQKLAEHLKYLSENETAYNKYLEWKTTGIGEMGNTTIGRWWKKKYPLFCQVCMRLAQGNLHPGLDIDTCKPRTYLDWKLYPPYGEVASSGEPKVQNVKSETTASLYLAVIAMSFGVILVVFNGIKVIVKLVFI